MNTEQWGLQARATGGGGTYPSLEKAKMDKQLNYTSTVMSVICICCRSQVQEITEVSSNSLMHDFHILFVL